MSKLDTHFVLFGDHTREIKYIDQSFALGADGVKILKPSSELLDEKYLYYFLKQSRLPEDAGYSRHFKFVKRLVIPLPPLEEQQRVAAILDKADAIRRKRQQAIDLTDQLLRSLFLDMFGDPVTNPKGWPMGTIRDFAADVRYGSSMKAGQKGNFPILRMNNITYSGGWNFRDLKYIELSDKDQAKFLVNQGEILFNRTNSKKLVGKTAVYRKVEPMAFAGYLIRIRTNELANPEYIAAYLNSLHGKVTLLSMCKNIIGMANINAQEMQGIKIALPPKLLQDQYAEIVHRTLINRNKYLVSKNEADNLFNSLTQSAFRGELIKQTKAA